MQISAAQNIQKIRHHTKDVSNDQMANRTAGGAKRIEKENLSRREFLAGSAVAVGGLVVAFHVPNFMRMEQATATQESQRIRQEPALLLQPLKLLLQLAKAGLGCAPVQPQLDGHASP